MMGKIRTGIAFKILIYTPPFWVKISSIIYVEKDVPVSKTL
jgi:hypothetical protein